MLQLSCLSGLGKLDVVADCDADGSCGGGGDPCLLHSELCCPNDSLDDDTVVIEIIQDEELLKDLAIAASLPPTTGHRNENIKSGCWWGVSSAGGTPPVHATLLDNSLWTAWTTTSSSLAAEPPPAVSRLVVPSRKRDRSVMRDTRSWTSSLDMMASIPTRRRSPNNCRRGNGVRQQGLVSRRGSRRLQRACSRCDSRETPHWRAGPDGPGTLCNACGIRYTRQQCKLLPEYRPSASQSRKQAWSS
ncbi:unnamed protein product [Miscanthus lutarioriparius]|uniref:GATA-type domain-containing protein n=1 Tax=Miscanthus lutarioriparius TaxID=422564 RepID=A0A811PZS7_9POAL|nr:unnamed protein product [Miscanthus lutarioriparius]